MNSACSTAETTSAVVSAIDTRYLPLQLTYRDAIGSMVKVDVWSLIAPPANMVTGQPSVDLIARN